ncbi:hypothetical protein IVA96_20270 [Bradyrhizobium sp. 159]|uniref:hypothetical protein n=1 Tax=Bradyrhizobium sp. 159 TaxID=2782632 RepID=UPI001FF8D726|nr:hypothetical protein [Bradyrhizobium sp. 159]MCK1618928.1 hypothetical protein [Bradyrhizobium sp. 159]
MRFLVFCLAIIGLAVLFGNSYNASPAQPAIRAENATDPVEYVRAMIAQPRAEVKGEVVGDVLKVQFSMDPWALTKGWVKTIFQKHVKDIVPGLFTKFPNIKEVTLTGMGTFRDIKGNESVEKSMVVRFSRQNASTVNWKNIDTENVMRVADFQWHHPAFDRD